MELLEHEFEIELIWQHVHKRIIIEVKNVAERSVNLERKFQCLQLHIPKNKLANVNFCPSLLGQTFFGSFVGRMEKKTKSPFEIK